MTTDTPALGSKLEPSPLDAYVTAEPDEPVFTLQAGDPLAAPLVILWSRLARARCGLGYEPEATENWLAAMLADTQLEKQLEKEDLLRRATEAEQVAWAMESYRKGQLRLELNDTTVKPVIARLDLHDYKIYCANRVSNAFSELADMMEQLNELDPHNPAIESIRLEIVALRSLFNELEPRPGRQLVSINAW